MTDPLTTDRHHSHQRPGAKRSRNVTRRHTHTHLHGPTGGVPSDKALSDTRGRSWTDLWSKVQTWLRVRVLVRVAPLQGTRPSPRLARHPTPHPPASSAEYHPPISALFAAGRADYGLYVNSVDRQQHTT
eukprot:scaffold29290_cov153-Isochrysis_galbana.AAC.2